MKLQTSSSTKPTQFHIPTENSNVMEMGMDVNNGNQISAFFLLSSTLYKEPYRAIVRELVSNAIDASKAAKTSEAEATPVILNVPKTIDSDDFYVQDFGIGMTLEQVINVYGNYFASNKQNDSNSIGGFGLGGKTPFIYVKDNPNGFKLETTSPEDNVRRTFVFKMQTNQYGGLQPVYSYLDGLDQPNSKIKGTKISFKLNDAQDIPVFAESIIDILFSLYPIQFKGIFEVSNGNGDSNAFSDIATKLIQQHSSNSNFKYTNKNSKKARKKLASESIFSSNTELTKFSEDFSYLPVSLKDSKEINTVSLVLGNIFYSYQLDKNNERNGKFKYLQELHQLIQFVDGTYSYLKGLPIFYSDKNGIVSFSLSREYIQDTQENTQTIINTVDVYLNVEIQKALDNLKKLAAKLGEQYLMKSKKVDNLIDQATLYQSIVYLIETNKKYHFLEQSLLDDLQNSLDSFTDVNKLLSCFLIKSEYAYHTFTFSLQKKTLLNHLTNQKNCMFNDKTHHFLILDNAKESIKQDWIKNGIVRILHKIYNRNHYYYMISQEQYQLLKDNYLINSDIFMDVNHMIQQEMVAQEEKKKQQELVKLEKQKQREVAKQAALIYKEQMLQNESNGFYLVDFIGKFNLSKQKKLTNFFPKELNLHMDSMQIKPIILPENLKLPIITENCSEILVKNMQFLANLEILSFKTNQDKKNLAGLAYLKKTNSFLNQHIDFKQIDKKIIFKKPNGHFDGIYFNEMFYGISKLMPFKFESKLNDTFDLSTMDLHQHLLDEIQVRLNHIYQELDKQIDLKLMMKQEMKAYMINKYYLNNMRDITGAFHELYKPFISLISGQLEKINQTIFDVKLNGYLDVLVEEHIGELNSVDKFSMINALSRFFDIVNKYRKITGEINIKEYDMLKLVSKNDNAIMKKLLEIYPIKKHPNVDFKYSKDFYLEFIKPIIHQLELD